MFSATASSTLYESLRLAFSFLHLSLDWGDLDTIYFLLASSLSVFSLMVLSDTQLGRPQGSLLPTTFSATSLTAVSKDSYLSVMLVESSVMLSAWNRFDSSSWNSSLVVGSCNFLQLNFGLLHGFPFLVLKLVARRMLTMRWSESSSTEL